MKTLDGLMCEALGVTRKELRERDRIHAENRRNKSVERHRLEHRPGGIRDLERELKSEVIRAYSKDGLVHCSCCGYGSLGFQLGALCLIHGSVQSGVLGYVQLPHNYVGLHGQKLYEQVKTDGYPSGFIVLCLKCVKITSGFGADYPLKRKVLAKYLPSGFRVIRCARCLDADVSGLTLHHLGGGGEAHRKALGLQGGRSFYQYLWDHGCPSGYEVLDWNCHQLSRESPSDSP